MEKVKYRLKGHESFTLREGWITKGINAVVKDSKLYTVNNGADALGVGTNMAKSIRYWMRTAGLTSESSSKGVRLTALGEIIKNNDIYVEDIFTLWILHANIVSNFDNATSWNLFFNHMDLSSSFERDEMQQLMRALLVEYTSEENLSERSIKDDCAAILSMYARGGQPSDDPEDKRTSPFEELGLVGRTGNKYIKKRPTYDRLNPLALLYLFVEKLNEEGSIQIDLLADGYNMPGKIMNLNRIAVNDYLDVLNKAGYINVDRTAGLDIIYPLNCKGMKKEDVIISYYSGRKSL